MSLPPGLEGYNKKKLNISARDYTPRHIIVKTKEENPKSNLVWVLKQLNNLEEANTLLKEQLEEKNCELEKKDTIIRIQNIEIDKCVDIIFLQDIKINKEFNINNYSKISFCN